MDIDVIEAPNSIDARNKIVRPKRTQGGHTMRQPHHQTQTFGGLGSSCTPLARLLTELASGVRVMLFQGPSTLASVQPQVAALEVLGKPSSLARALEDANTMFSRPT
jgi:hypothetical protein